MVHLSIHVGNTLRLVFEKIKLIRLLTEDLELQKDIAPLEISLLNY